tara:strand:- start:3841 stop:4191 length:351 start_codon:yes stop_codon:yes gene_type:complete
MFPWHQYLLALLLIIAGVMHFVKPKMYERIIPPYIPSPKAMVQLSGFAEMILGLALLNADSQSWAAWGIILMLLIFLTVHVYMLQNKKASLRLPRWVLIIRIPLQFLLMYWAYLYT